MAIKIVVANKVTFKVRGTINGEDGRPEPFDFKLKCERLEQDAFRDLLQESNGQPIADFLVSVAEDWDGVRDEDNKPVPFSEEALRQLCRIQGVAHVMFAAYVSESGAKPKN